MIFFCGYIFWNIYSARKSGAAAAEETSAKPTSLAVAVILVILGIAALVAGGKILVTGAVEIGLKLGIREAVIGLTIVAIGTSLPELATSVVAALHKESDIAIGNVIGSNIFNILAIVGIAPLVKPFQSPSINVWDWVVMLLLTLLLYPCSGKKLSIGRKSGFFLLLIFVAYTAWLVYSAK